MIAQIDGYEGRPEFVALHPDPRTQARAVWVPVRGDRGNAGEESAMAAVRLCLDEVNALLGPVLEAARKVHRLADVRGRNLSADEKQLLLALSQHVTETLDRVGVNLLRLIDEPTADDDVEMDAKYVVVAAKGQP